MESKSFFFCGPREVWMLCPPKKTEAPLSIFWQFDGSNFAEKSKKPVGQNKSLGDQSSTAFPSEAGLRKETNSSFSKKNHGDWLSGHCDPLFRKDCRAPVPQPPPKCSEANS